MFFMGRGDSETVLKKSNIVENLLSKMFNNCFCIISKKNIIVDICSFNTYSNYIFLSQIITKIYKIIKSIKKFVRI